MQTKMNDHYKEIKKTMDSNKLLKTAVYIGAGLVSLYVLGKILKVVASSVRGFNDLKIGNEWRIIKYQL
jgi:hypothetical protein